MTDEIFTGQHIGRPAPDIDIVIVGGNVVVALIDEFGHGVSPSSRLMRRTERSGTRSK